MLLLKKPHSTPERNHTDTFGQFHSVFRRQVLIFIFFLPSVCFGGVLTDSSWHWSTALCVRRDFTTTLRRLQLPTLLCCCHSKRLQNTSVLKEYVALFFLLMCSFFREKAPRRDCMCVCAEGATKKEQGTLGLLKHYDLRI